MNYAEIQLTQGKVAIVDASDFDWLNQWNWCANKGRRLSTGEYPWYASRTENNRHILMHRLVVGAPTGIEVDHKDGDGLHNWKENLRLATPRQNRQHMVHGVIRGKTSRFKGVVKYQRSPKTKKPWRAYTNGSALRPDGSSIALYLGSFAFEEDAARAYDAAVIREHGEFAVTNESLGLFIPIAERRAGRAKRDKLREENARLEMIVDSWQAAKDAEVTVVSELLRRRYSPTRGWSGDPEVIKLCDEHERLEAERDKLREENARLEMIVDSWQAAKDADVTVWPR